MTLAQFKLLQDLTRSVLFISRELAGDSILIKNLERSANSVYKERDLNNAFPPPITDPVSQEAAKHRAPCFLPGHRVFLVGDDFNPKEVYTLANGVNVMPVFIVLSHEWIGVNILYRLLHNKSHEIKFYFEEELQEYNSR